MHEPMASSSDDVAYAPAVAVNAPVVQTINPATLPKPSIQSVTPEHMVSVPKPKTTSTVVGQQAVQAANKKAQQQPDTQHFQDAIMTFDYVPGSLFKIYCAPMDVTDIQLQTGERVTSVAAGDTLRWQVSKTFSGAGSSMQQHLLVKPTQSAIHNSLVVTTNRRTYHLQLLSTNDTYVAIVRWRYADTQDFVKHYAQPTKPLFQQASIDVNHLNFHYDVTVAHEGETPAWMPTGVFSDGHKTYIQFPANLQQAPVLFVGNADQPVITNYRVQGNFYVVDRLISHAQLRMGQSDPTIVLITRRTS
ncbi:MAG: hypothetical protein DHS20C10_00840 [marine bacterium B5-7]|nr:MAG: hypothetical protein DHS20C10_00840 [marine bacterium B5-7]